MELTLKIITIVVSILSLLGVGTFFSLWMKDKYEEKKKHTTEYLEAKKKRKQEEMREVIQQELQPVNERLNKVHEQLQINNDGTCAGLRHHLLTFYYDCAKKGYRTRDDSENFTDMYDAYTQLGGNSFIQKDVSKWFYELPSEEQFKGDK